MLYYACLYKRQRPFQIEACSLPVASVMSASMGELIGVVWSLVWYAAQCQVESMQSHSVEARSWVG